MPIFRRYFDQECIKEIHNYKYKPGIYTPLDNFMSANVWEPLVEFVPRWMAPNILTLAGFICTFVAFLAVVLPCPTLDTPMARLNLVIVAVATFLYQTLDALDGKQARRTKSFSPLGTLFDHGCDIVTVTFLSIASAGVMQTGATLHTFVIMATSTHILQFLYLLYEYYFHVFNSNPGFSVTGVTEAQFSIILSALFAAVTWPGIYAVKLLPWSPFGHDLTLGNVLTDVVVVNNCVSVVYYVFAIVHKLEMSKKIFATLQIIAYFAFIKIEWMFFKATVVDASCCHLAVYLTITVVYSTILIRLLLASVSQRVFSIVQWPAIPFAAATLLLATTEMPTWAKNVVVAGTLAFQLTFLGDFLVTGINDLCTELKISCFTIQDKAQEKAD